MTYDLGTSTRSGPPEIVNVGFGGFYTRVGLLLEEHVDSYTRRMERGF